MESISLTFHQSNLKKLTLSVYLALKITRGLVSKSSDELLINKENVKLTKRSNSKVSYLSGLTSGLDVNFNTSWALSMIIQLVYIFTSMAFTLFLFKKEQKILKLSTYIYIYIYSLSLGCFPKCIYTQFYFSFFLANQMNKEVKAHWTWFPQIVQEINSQQLLNST